jgi:phenylpropionate dioxygenase-like ring-hydroxylating dioxygenase large terminal subunit
VIRGDDGEVRAFYNVCRHRAARLLDSDQGRCERGRITCPYHGWTYDLHGRLIGVPRAGAYPGLQREEWSLHAPDLEVWQGFIFVRCAGDGPGVAELLAPWADLLDAYRMPEMRALGRMTLRPRQVNWKTIVENYADGLHIDIAHRGLAGLAGDSYGLEAGGQVMHMHADLDGGSARGSGELYRRLLPPVSHLPGSLRRRWNYFLLWPNLAFDLYPDQVDFMQMIPLGPGRTLIREIPYALPDDRREMRAARYLNWRVNRQVNAEDRGLIERVQQGMDSGVFSQGPLSADEVCLRALAGLLRARIPEARLQAPPWSGAR